MRFRPIHLEILLHGLHDVADQVAKKLLIVEIFHVLSDGIVECQILRAQVQLFCAFVFFFDVFANLN